MKYTAFLHKDTNSSYGVSFPDLPGCYSGGETEEEAMRNAAEALALHVSTLRELGREVPVASAFEAIAEKSRAISIKAFQVAVQ